jgi:hypothetical protein
MTGEERLGHRSALGWTRAAARAARQVSRCRTARSPSFGPVQPSGWPMSTRAPVVGLAGPRVVSVSFTQSGHLSCSSLHRVLACPVRKRWREVFSRPEALERVVMSRN